MELSPSWWASSRSDSQIRFILREPKVHFRVRKKLRLDSTLSHSVYILISEASLTSSISLTLHNLLEDVRSQCSLKSWKLLLNFQNSAEQCAGSLKFLCQCFRSLLLNRFSVTKVIWTWVWISVVTKLWLFNDDVSCNIFCLAIQTSCSWMYNEFSVVITRKSNRT